MTYRKFSDYNHLLYMVIYPAVRNAATIADQKAWTVLVHGIVKGRRYGMGK
jgi:hypothetical protein